MPKSPKRKKKVRIRKYRPNSEVFETFRVISDSERKPLLWLRKFLCFLFGCAEEIETEGYPRYNKHYHVHYQCTRCGNERIVRDDSIELRPRKYPMSHEVITFYKREQEYEHSDSEIFP